MENKETKQGNPAGSCDAGIVELFINEDWEEERESEADQRAEHRCFPPLSLILPPGRTDRPTQPASKEASACCS